MQPTYSRRTDSLVRIYKKSEMILLSTCRENKRGKHAGLEPSDFLERIRNVDKILKACKAAI